MSPRIPRILGVAATVVLLLALPRPIATAATGPIDLQTAAAFAVLAGSGVTNTGSSVIDGDLGADPTGSVSGFPPGLLNGTRHLADGVARQAEADLDAAYVDAAGRRPDDDVTGVDLGGSTLGAGVYDASTSMSLTGTVTLDAKGDPDAEFVLRAGSTLVTASGSAVSLVGGAQACRVWWQVGTSATLGTSTRFAGTIMASTSATLGTGASVEGRVLARDGAVTLDTNRITRPACSAPAPAPAPSPVPTTPVPTTSGPTTPAPTATPVTGSSAPGSTGNPTSSPTSRGPSPSSPDSGGTSSSGTTGTTGTTASAALGGSGTTGSSTLGGGSGTVGTAGGSVVPSGHPDTGRVPDRAVAAAAPSPLRGRLLGVGLLAAAGAALVATRGGRGVRRQR